MSLHKEARKIQLRTVIKDLQSKTSGYNIASVAKRLNEQLKQSQEEYKILTGNYLEGSTGKLDETIEDFFQWKKEVEEFWQNLIYNQGNSGAEALLELIANDYEDKAEDLTNQDAKGIAKHLREAIALIKQRTGN